MKFRTLQPSTICASLFALAGFGIGASHARAQDVDFMRDVKPLLEGACVQCHGPNQDELEADYRIDTKAAAFAGGSAYKGEVIFPGEANKSPVYWMTNLHEDEPDSDECMPPKKPLNKAQQQVLFDWIQGGAEWPDGVVLEDKPRVTFANVRPLLLKGGPFNTDDKDVLRLWVEQGSDWPEDQKLGGGGPDDNLDLIKKIHQAIVAGSPEKSFDDMKPYESAIPKTDVKYAMVPIPGGEFLMGSPESEDGHFDDEGPQRKVAIEPFWMGKYEVTWDMLNGYTSTNIGRNKDGSPISIPDGADDADITSAPTAAFMPMDFGMGVNGFPAVGMTQHLAQKFCQWLSAQTGHYYRLPTEAEWEYACRAGTTTAFSHGDSEEGLADYAVYDPEQVLTGYERVGSRKPNPWGLHDMHGNVMEWCLDQYLADAYSKRSADGVTAMPFEKPTHLFPRVARGGSWYDPAEELRSARRVASDLNWKKTDPQLPQSIWYHTDAPWLGFRIVRPLKTPSAEEMQELWDIGTVDAEEATQ